MVIGTDTLLVSFPERAILECLNLSDASSNLLDIYYVMESLTTLRPRLLQSLLEGCTSQKVQRLFLYMAEKATPWAWLPAEQATTPRAFSSSESWEIL